jgi:hypothetical protein
MPILNVGQTYFPVSRRRGLPVKVRVLSRKLAQRGHSVTVLTVNLGSAEWLAMGVTPKKTSASWRTVEDGVEAIYLPTWLRYRSWYWKLSKGVIGSSLYAPTTGWPGIRDYMCTSRLSPRFRNTSIIIGRSPRAERGKNSKSLSKRSCKQNTGTALLADPAASTLTPWIPLLSPTTLPCKCQIGARVEGEVKFRHTRRRADLHIGGYPCRFIT